MQSSPTPAFATPSTTTCCSVIELRQYELHPGSRETLIDLFDRAFHDALTETGMHVIGEFRDLDDPDRFVWLRGFPDLPSRAASLRAFYEEGDVWKTHRDEANGTMIDSDNVLQLRPVDGGPGCAELAMAVTNRTAPMVAATVYHLKEAVDEETVRFFESQVAPVLTRTGARHLASFVTESAENNFPRLPVRTGENVFVWFSAFASLEAHADHVAQLARSAEWTRLQPELTGRLVRESQQLRLVPSRNTAPSSTPESPAR